MDDKTLLDCGCRVEVRTDGYTLFAECEWHIRYVKDGIADVIPEDED